MRENGSCHQVARYVKSKEQMNRDLERAKEKEKKKNISRQKKMDEKKDMAPKTGHITGDRSGKKRVHHL